jgi:CRP/FNR family transcriptional regulator, cyclic AMP receptor protein
MSRLEERVRRLSLVSIFEPLSQEEIERLDGQLTNIHLERGEFLYTPEDRSEKLYVLLKGRVREYKVVDDRELTIVVLETGMVFGEMALTAQEFRGVYAQALEPSEVSVISRKNLEQIILDKPQVGVKIAQVLSERLRWYGTRLEDITLRDVPARLASLILSFIEIEGVVSTHHQLKIPTHYTHRELGTMIGVKREAVTRAFARLQDAGAVELRRRYIFVVNVEALRRIARPTSELVGRFVS